MIRDIVRKNYCMYYTQENLLDLKVQQNAEVERLEAEDEALKVYINRIWTNLLHFIFGIIHSNKQFILFRHNYKHST